MWVALKVEAGLPPLPAAAVPGAVQYGRIWVAVGGNSATSGPEKGLRWEGEGRRREPCEVLRSAARVASRDRF